MNAEINLTSELAQRWLRECLCAPSVSNAAARAQAISAEEDFVWAAVYFTAVEQWIVPPVYENACRLALLPPGMAARWQAEQERNARQTREFLNQLERCVSALAAADIPVITLKGAAYAFTVYDRPELRSMRDIDLLVKSEEVARARTVLETEGYFQRKTEPQPGAHVEFENEIALYKQDSASGAIELHWNLIDSPYYQTRLASAQFWESAREIRVGEMTLRVLGNEMQFLYACAHLWLHHRGDELLWLYDLRLMLEKGGGALDWDAVFARAAELEWTLPVRQTLMRLRDEWYLPLPFAATQWLETASGSAQEAKQFVRVRDRSSVGRRFWADLTTTDSWSRRARFAASNLFPSPAYMRERYGLQNPIAVALAYPYRWWRGVASLWKK